MKCILGLPSVMTAPKGTGGQPIVVIVVEVIGNSNLYLHVREAKVSKQLSLHGKAPLISLCAKFIYLYLGYTNDSFATFTPLHHLSKL